MTRMLQWILRDLGLISQRETLVMVRSWIPFWDRERRELSWPTLLVQKPGQRATISPIWDRVRLRGILLGETH